jgi:hypothetical protein
MTTIGTNRENSTEEVLPLEFTAAAETTTTLPEGDSLQDIYYDDNSYSTSKDYVTPTIQDKLRARTGSYWALINSQNPLSGPQIELLKNVDNPPLIFPFITNPADSTTENYSKTQTARITFNSSNSLFQKPFDGQEIEGDELRLYQLDLLQKMIEGGMIRNLNVPEIDKSREYEDYLHKSNCPYSNREVDMKSSAVRTKHAKIGPKYNFLIPQYEEAAARTDIPETALPNMYAMFSVLEHDMEDKKSKNLLNPSFRDLITIRGNAQIEKPENILSQNQRLDLKQEKTEAYRYFERWSRATADIFENTFFAVGKKYNNVLLTHSNVELLKNADKFNLFPMYMDIEFDTQIRTPIADIFDQSELIALAYSDITNGKAPVENKNIIIRKTNPLPPPSSEMTMERVMSQQNISQTVNESPATIDVEEWIMGLKERINNAGPLADDQETIMKSLEDLEGRDSVFLGNINELVKMSPNKKYSFFKSFSLYLLEAKLKEQAEKYTRSWQDIMNGKKAKSETLFYRIEKRRGSLAGSVIQNIFLPNSSKIDVARYMDTQVKYGQQYTYVIYAYDLVYGTKYKYKSITPSEDGQGYTAIVDYAPSIKIVETQYFRYTTQMLDSAPVSPDVQIIPYRGINNKLRISFNPNVGTYENYPEYIEEEENFQIKKLLLSQDRYKDEKMLYSSDDQARRYEVWRLEKKPKSYRDFAGNKVNELDLRFDLTNLFDDATSGSLEENIQPNKKYWYVFRSIDYHGNISYPSALYEVELVDDAGGVFPKVEVVDFEEQVPKTPMKMGKRIVSVMPRMTHTMVNYEKSNLEGADSVLERWSEGNFFLGVEEQSIWGKKFKIRLTSKKTGKKVDLNFEFQYEHERIKPEGYEEKKPDPVL